MTTLQEAEKAARAADAEVQRLRAIEAAAAAERAAHEAEAKERFLTARAHVARRTMRRPDMPDPWPEFVAAVRAGADTFAAWCDYREAMLSRTMYHTIREGVIRQARNVREQRLIDARDRFYQMHANAVGSPAETPKDVKAKRIRAANTAINEWMSENGRELRDLDSTTPPGWDDFGIVGLNNIASRPAAGYDYAEAMTKLVEAIDAEIHNRVERATINELDTLARAALEGEE